MTAAALVVLAVLAPLAGPAEAQQVDVPEALDAMARAFVAKAEDHPAFAADIRIDGVGTWSVRFDGERGYVVDAAPAERPVFRFGTDLPFFGRLARGEITGMTATGQARPSDPTPLRVEQAEGADDVEDVRDLFFQMAMHFFNPTVPGRVDLDLDAARVIHGAPGIALFYHEGFRSGWFRVVPGRQLNEAGDTNPFPQTFIVIGGSGTLTIGDEAVPVREGEAYFIPPGQDHVVVADEGSYVELVWIAWGEGS